MSALGMIGMARRAGRLIYGMDSVENNAARARLIVLSRDAGKAVVRNVAHITEGRNIPVLRLPESSEELGHAIGVSVCAVAAITDAGMARAILAKNPAETPPESPAL